ncbi:hypothetical protein GN958_ATG16037 [Phytophthora infestans]|uniref:Transmembrane protein n=1 Tax=Phytophthora infestans TaxID=4787 RepID=A0A8S9U1H8_PHYIN|nr:hypothetical protein GN958_ATG16037 [Phytophthora infestans]
MAERARVAVQQMQRDSDKKKEDQRPPIWLGSGPEPTVLVPSNSYVACYRDSQWQRLPMNLLVEGDVVGLMSGGIAPGEVRPVEGDGSESFPAAVLSFRHKRDSWPFLFAPCIPYWCSWRSDSVGIWLSFASLNTPLVLNVAEAAATASIFGSFDDILAPKESTSHEQEQDVGDGSNEEETPEKVSTKSEYTKTSNKYPRQDERLSGIDSAMASILKATAFAPPDIFDVEDREKLASPDSVNMSLDQESISGVRAAKSAGAPPSGQITPPSKRLRNFTTSDLESSVGLHPSETSAVEKDSMLWRWQDDQIFLGMVATGVQPKQHTPDELLAEKMGIETNWNWAILLRPLESDGPDPHRMTANYSDWDVKARLPHGVEAIKRHLAEVDNVPLPVSPYTDSTPDTISEMISIFQENHEVVMGVGSSLKESNAPLFSKADLAVALQGGVHAFFDEPIPHGKELPVLSDEDVQLSHILNTLACVFRLKSAPDDASSQDKARSEATDGKEKDNATTDGTASVAHLIEIIRLGRRMLSSFHQVKTFMFVSQLFIATIILASYSIPFLHVPQLSCASVFWLLWIFGACPRRLFCHVPSVLLSIAVFECLLGFSLQASNVADPSAFGEQFCEYRWTDFVLHVDSELVTMMPRPAVVSAAVDRAEAGTLLLIGVCMLTSSCGYLYRCESCSEYAPCGDRWC